MKAASSAVLYNSKGSSAETSSSTGAETSSTDSEAVASVFSVPSLVGTVFSASSAGFNSSAMGHC